MFQECSKALWCIAASVLGNAEQARDVVQEAAIVGLRKRDEFQPGTSFVHWMGQIVRFTALNQGRRSMLRLARDREHVSGSARAVGREPAPEREGEWFDDQTRRALQQLDETARSCLLMRTVLDMSYRQIAEALGIPENTAMSHVHRSRQKMREALLAARREDVHA